MKEELQTLTGSTVHLRTKQMALNSKIVSIRQLQQAVSRLIQSNPGLLENPSTDTFLLSVRIDSCQALVNHKLLLGA